MNKMLKVTVLCALLCLLYSSFVRAESNEAAETDKSLFENKCSFCHEKERPLSKRKNMEGWTATVKRMQSKDPSHINDTEAERIIGYLSLVRGEESPVNKVNDPSNLSDLEKKHVPVIQVEFEDAEKKTAVITVKIGETQHPMETLHYIKYIEIYLNGEPAGKVELKPGDNPEAVFNSIRVEGKRISALEECNLHGKWEGNAQ